MFLIGRFLLIISVLISQVSLSIASFGPAPKDRMIEDWCRHLAKELKSVNFERCMKRPWKVEELSNGNRPIPYMAWGGAVSVEQKKENQSASKEVLKKASENLSEAVPEDMPKRVLVLGAIHGDEISAVSVVFRWIDFLEKTKEDSFLRKNSYLFFPLVNPDGFYARPRTRTNLNGIDINRNFATEHWDEKALLWWKTKARKSKRRYPGEKGGSEIETQLVQRWIETFKPDLIISVHAPYCLVDHDGPIIFPKTKSPLPVRALGAYPGSLGTYAGLERSIPVVTPELSSANQIPSPKAVEDLFLFIMRAKVN